MNIPTLLWPLVLSFGTALLISALFYLALWRSTKNKLRKDYQLELMAYQKKHAEQAEEMINESLAQLRSDFAKEIESSKIQLREEYFWESELYKSELGKNNEFELQVLRTKIRNVQSSYPRKIEAQQKLAVLADSILLKHNNSKTQPILDPSRYFEEKEDLLSRYLLEYAGIVDPSVEEQLSRCITYCKEGKNLSADDTNHSRLPELAERLAYDLLQAKKLVKKDTAIAK